MNENGIEITENTSPNENTKKEEKGGEGKDESKGVSHSMEDKELQKKKEMAMQYQKVTRNLAREISKKDGFSLMTQTEEKKEEPPIPEEPPKEPEDGLSTEVTFEALTAVLFGLEVKPFFLSFHCFSFYVYLLLI